MGAVAEGKTVLLGGLGMEDSWGAASTVQAEPYANFTRMSDLFH
jgi:hypothetical protein